MSSPFGPLILPRRGRALTCAALLAMCLLAASLPAQQSKQKGPRALAVLEFTGPNKARLIPIEVLIDGKFRDATIYQASPVPMALQPGVVYEAFRSGTPEGLFTLNNAQELQGAWVGLGSWQPEAQGPVAAVPAEHKINKSYDDVPRGMEDTDQPPVLKRGSPASDGSGSPPPSPPPAQSSPPSAQTPPVAQTPPPAPPDNTGPGDSDRPVLRRRTAPGEQTTAPEAQNVPKSAPAAPKPSPNQTANPVPTASPAPAPQALVLPAISDAGGPEPHSFLFQTKAEEMQRLTKAATSLAVDSVMSYAKLHPVIRLKPPVALSDVSVKLFDLSYTNEPILVLTGHLPLSPSSQASSARLPSNIYVTVVAREDTDGSVRRIFSSTTDNTRLDVTPRLQLIDAVDVDGDGRGELLFKHVSDAGAGYIVYRAGRDQLWTLFNSRAQ